MDLLGLYPSHLLGEMESRMFSRFCILLVPGVMYEDPNLVFELIPMKMSSIVAVLEKKIRFSALWTFTLSNACDYLFG